MEEVLALLQELGCKGWTLAAIADELGVARYTVDRWRRGIARPAGMKGTKLLLQQLLRRKRIPKQRRASGKVKTAAHSPRRRGKGR